MSEIHSTPGNGSGRSPDSSSLDDAFDHPVTRYALAVAGGQIVAGELVRLACERHIEDLFKGHERGLWFDTDAADHALSFFGFLRHSKGEWAGRPFELADWQVFIVGSLFGWKMLDQESGEWYRRFRTAYLSVARKNGKTQLAAGIGLYLAFFDGEPGAEVYSAATTESQAKICWAEAKRMVRKSPALRSRIQAFTKNLSRESTAQKFEPKANEPETLDGLNPHGAIIDEYHAHPTGELADVLESGTGARRQPMMVYTTTAGYNAAGACAMLDRDVQNILRGIGQDDAVFAYVARIDEKDRWNDRSVWIKANPNLGISVKLADLERACQRAERIPREQNEFRRKRCNQWVEQAERWLDMDQWDACSEPVDIEALQGMSCFAGLDLSRTSDLSAFVAVFPGDDGSVQLVCRFWMPEDDLDLKAKRDGVPYREWIEAGYITATLGNVTDYDAVREEIEAFSQEYDVVEIPYDTWNATQLAVQLGSAGATMVPLGQGFKDLSEPSKELEALVRGGKLRHGGNPVLRWMAANVAIERGPNDSIRPVKKKSSGRIDGIVAAVMAIARLIVHQQAASTTSIYEERGFLGL